jgi:hypothetical protein
MGYLLADFEAFMIGRLFCRMKRMGAQDALAFSAIFKIGVDGPGLGGLRRSWC